MNMQLEAANKMVAMLEQKNKELEENAQIMKVECDKFNATVQEYSDECTKLLKVTFNVNQTYFPMSVPSLIPPPPPSYPPLPPLVPRMLRSMRKRQDRLVLRGMSSSRGSII